MCLGAFDRFHAPISNETHRLRRTRSLLGILSAQLPASDEKKKEEAWHVVRDGEGQKNKDKQREKSAIACIR